MAATVSVPVALLRQLQLQAPPPLPDGTAAAPVVRPGTRVVVRAATPGQLGTPGPTRCVRRWPR